VNDFQIRAIALLAAVVRAHGKSVIGHELLDLAETFERYIRRGRES
jgi:hypothetical protein